jgi:hypothetical protein
MEKGERDKLVPLLWLSGRGWDVPRRVLGAFGHRRFPMLPKPHL